MNEMNIKADILYIPYYLVWTEAESTVQLLRQDNNIIAQEIMEDVLEDTLWPQKSDLFHLEHPTCS